MKKIFFFILILAAVITYFMWDYSPSVENQSPQTNNGAGFQPDASSATFTFGHDDGPVTFSNGRFINDTGADWQMLENRAYGDINSDGKQDSVVFIVDNSGGSGIFIYAAAYVSGPVNYKGTNAVFLGDRIAPQNISISNGVATVSYLDRDLDEALAAEPTVPVSTQFVYRSGVFQER